MNAVPLRQASKFSAPYKVVIVLACPHLTVEEDIDLRA